MNLFHDRFCREMEYYVKAGSRNNGWSLGLLSQGDHLPQNIVLLKNKIKVWAKELYGTVERLSAVRAYFNIIYPKTELTLIQNSTSLRRAQQIFKEHYLEEQTSDWHDPDFSKNRSFITIFQNVAIVLELM